MQYSKEKEAELRKQERLKQLNKAGKIPIEFKFLTINEIKDEDMLLVEEIQKVAPRDLIAFERIEKVMYPGGCSTEGFLAKGEKLYDVFQKDDETLKRLGITYDQIADKLEEIAENVTLTTVHLGDLIINCACFFGHQECPFGCTEELKEIGKDIHDPVLTKTMSSTDFTITHQNTGETLFFSGLHAHLIRDHHFFEGNTKYRLDPERAIQILGIKGLV